MLAFLATGVLVACPAPPVEAALRIFQAGGGACNLHLLLPTGEVEVGEERACYSTVSHQAQGVALGPAGGVVMALGREGSAARDIIVDDGQRRTISLLMSATWQVAVDGENFIVARPDIVGVVEPSDGTVRTLVEEFSRLYTASTRAFGTHNSRPDQSKFVDWVAYEQASRRPIARIEGADNVVGGSGSYLLVRGESGLLRASRDGGVGLIPHSADVALGCIWGERVVLVSAVDRRSIRIWSHGQAPKAVFLASPVDDLLCGCGASPFFVAISQQGQGSSMGVNLDGEQRPLPVPLIRVDNPGPFWTSDCEPTRSR